MTKLKIDTKLGSGAADAIESHIRPLYDLPNATRLAIIELRHIERTQPASESDADSQVKVRITHMELPSKEQEGVVREALHALHLMRTASGTLDEHGQIEISRRTLQYTGAELHALETARLRAGLGVWADVATRLNAKPEITLAELRAEVAALAKGLRTVLYYTDPEDNEQ